MGDGAEYRTDEGDCRDVLKGFQLDSLDCCVTDPPYDLLIGSRNGSGRSNEPDNPYGRHGSHGKGFMGLAWDGTGVAFDPGTWRAVFRALKPGAFLLAFGSPRTSHRLACAIEDAGFVLRDTIMFLHGTGFPKNLDVGKAIDKMAGAERKVVGVKPGHEQFAGRTTTGHIDFKGDTQGFDRPWMHDTDARARYHEATAPATDAARQWDGWGTQLKPAFEPILIARKPPTEKNIALQVLKTGTGALNIGASRIGTSADMNPRDFDDSRRTSPKFDGVFNGGKTGAYRAGTGAVPPGRWPANVILDEDAAAALDASVAQPTRRKGTPRADAMFDEDRGLTKAENGCDEAFGPSRFFYTTKVSRAERGRYMPDGEHHAHPTPKNMALMRYLVRLACRPGGTVLDPFLGSGSTGLAALLEGMRFVGIEQDPDHFRVATQRLARCKAELDAQR